MLKDNTHDPRPKIHFITDLIRLIKNITDKNKHIILGLNVNEVLEPLVS